MATERFLDDLAADLRPVRRATWARDGGVLAMLGLIELALFLGMGMARPDMAAAMHGPAFWWKMGGMAAIAVAATGVALRSFAPPADPSRGLRMLALLVAATIALGFATLDPHGPMMPRLAWRYGVACMVTMALLSIPFIVGLGLFMRRGAAIRPGPSALAAGIAGASWGAFVFAFHCRSDDPLYVTFWYLAGCGIATLVARLVLPMTARW